MPIVTESLQIPVELQDKVTSQVNAINRKLGDLDKGIDEYSKNRKKQSQEMERAQRAEAAALRQTMIQWSAAAAIVGVATKKIYEVGKAGAQIDYAAIKFDRLSKSAGTTSAVFLNQLRNATRGTVSDFKLMEQGSNLLQLGLARTSKEAVRLSRIQTALGMDTGELTLALANQSKRRLDQLGLNLAKFNIIEKQMKAAGMGKEDAFREAFMLTAEQTIATTGNAADSKYGDYMRFEASLANIKDEGKLLVADALAPTLQGVAAFMSGISDLVQGRRVWDFNQQNGMWTRELPTWATNESVQQRMTSLGGNTNTFGGMQVRAQAQSQLVNEARNRFYQTQAAQMGTAEATRVTPIDYATLVGGALKFADVNQKIAEAKQKLNEQLAEEQAKLVELQNTYGANTQQVIEQAEVVGQLQQQHIELAQSYKDSANDMMLGLIATAAGEEMAAEKQLEFARATGQVTDQAYAQQKAMMEIANQFAAGTMNADQAAAATLRVIEYLQMLDGMSVEAYINLVTTGNMPYGGGGQSIGGGTVNRPGTPPILMQASGGPFSGWAVTGDSPSGLTAHSELVYAPHGAYVYNASQTRALLNSGMTPQRYVSGGLVPGGSISLDGVFPVATTRPSDFGVFTSKPKNTDETSPTVTIASLFTEVAPTIAQDVAQSVTMSVIAQVSQSFQAAQAASAKLITDKFDEMIYLMRDNPRAVGENVGSQLARRS